MALGGEFQHKVSTSGVPVPRRKQLWEETFAGLLGQRIRIEPIDSASVEGELEYASLARLTFCRVEITRHTTSLPGSWPVIECSPLRIMFQDVGTSTFEQDGVVRTLEPGDALIFDVSKPHIVTNFDYTKRHVAVLPRELVKRRGIDLQKFVARKLSGEIAECRLARDCAVAVFQQAPDLSSPNALGISESILSLLLLPFFRECALTSNNAEIIRERAKLYIEANLQNADLSVQHVAHDVGCTKRYLHTIFGKEGMTVGQYIWHRRLEECRRQLSIADPSVTLSDIALSWGFNSGSHFSRLFRDRYGATASKVRAELRDKSIRLRH